MAKDEASVYERGRTIRWLNAKQDWTVAEDRRQRRLSTSRIACVLARRAARAGIHHELIA